MKSYTTLRNLYGSLTQNTTSGNLTLGDQFINDSYRYVLGSQPWWFLDKSETDTTVANQQFYQLPNDWTQLNTVTVAVGSTNYIPKEAPSREFWDLLNQAPNVKADIPEWFFIFDGQLGFYPTPSSAGNTITYYYKQVVKDLSIADYTTGTIVSVANGGTAVVGSSTVWTAPMAGRFIRITSSDTANTGDGFWYEIASVTDNTNLVLTKDYQGTAIAAGSANYTIGQMPLFPEQYHALPVYHATYQYWLMNSDPVKANQFKALYDELLFQMKQENNWKSSNPVVDYADGDEDFIRNPNLSIRL